MLKRLFIVVLVAVAMSFGALVRAAEMFKVDPVHSAVVFRIGHFNIGQIYGRFNLTEQAGKFVIDQEKPENSTFEIVIEAGNIDTANQKRDDHLRSPDFFNVKQFPQITFKSTSVKSAGDNVYEVTGDLTLHGVTRPITLIVNKLGEGKDPMGNYRAGLAVEFSVKRSDYGMDFMLQGIADEVHLMIGIEGTKQ